MHEPQITKRDDEEKFEKKAFKIAEELGDDYVSMLKEDFDGNLPEVLREYIAVKYPILSKDAEKVFEEAISVARGIESDSSRAYALRDIAKELAKVDIDRALSVAREIEDKDDRAEALLDIASELAKVDVERAKRIFEEAISAARGIERDSSKAEALSKIAPNIVKVDVDRALSIARGIEDDSDRAWALRDIASELVKIDVDRALSVARGIEWDSYGAEALSKIATELAKVDVERARGIFEEALSVARGIESDYSRAEALSKIASELAKIDMEGAKRIFEEALSSAREIKKKWERAWVLRDIASELAKVDVERALSVAKKIKDKYKRAEALRKIASELAKVDVERALSIARGIKKNSFREWALLDIASELAKVDVERALSIARGIKKNSFRALALSNIASEIAKVDIDRALSVAMGMEDEYGNREEALRNIASEIAKVDVDRALSVAKKIKVKKVRASALSKIASELAKQEAKKILTEMPDKLVLRMVMEGWGARQIKNTIKNYMEHREEVYEIYSRYDELMEYLKPFGITEELPEIDYTHIDTWAKESKRIITEMEKKKREIERLKNRISELRDKAHMLGMEIPENITEIDEMKRIISEAEERMESMKPSLSLNISGEITENLWSKAEVVVKNDGDINLENIKIEFQTDVMDVRGETKINSIKKGEKRRIPIRIKSKDAGYVPVELLVRYRNPLTEKDEEMRLFPEIFVASRTMTPSITPTPIGTEPPISEPDIQKLTRYELIEEIGSGGFALVYKVKRKSDERIVAVKIPKRWDEDSSSAFIDEVSIWQSLSRQDSAHIVKILRRSAVPFGYIEMEYMEKSLADLRFPLDPKVASEYMLSIAYAIYTAHSQKPPVIHMDIKPSNILINSEGIAKLGDWGIAGKNYKDTDLAGKGTLDFCSPEVLDPMEYGKPDEQSDIFSFGSTFYYIITGIKPFSGRNEEETMDNILSKDFVPKKPSEHSPDIPEVLDKVVMGCIEKSKEKRYRRIVEIICEMSDHLGLEVDLTSGKSTSLLTEVVSLRAERGHIVETRIALEELAKHAKTQKLREEIARVVETLEMEKDDAKGDKEAMETRAREMADTIKEIVEKLRMGG